MKYSITKQSIGVSIFVISMSLILIYWFEIEFSRVLLLFPIGVLGGLSSVFYLKYFNPSVKLFPNKWMLEGVLFGLFFSSINLMNGKAKHMISLFLIGITIGLLVRGLYYWWMKKNVKRLLKHPSAFVFEKASLRDINQNTVLGFLIVQDKELIFLDTSNDEELWRKELKSIEAELLTSKWNIPNEIQLLKENYFIQVNFPLFFMDLIEEKK
ncbi:hypothetical protein [Mesonia sp. K4-1]|uniref:hypothetical protein n=1 Tax=Mesonia sp. K4-1 TaxID=2602760 RepID=UPI0011CBD41B|nr:hypothetical protein [Mesonia sp. K4-1]TXK78804.1 hypothetical protein FT986_03130 [Mesonia sp. K4-1]